MDDLRVLELDWAASRLAAQSISNAEFQLLGGIRRRTPPLFWIDRIRIASSGFLSRLVFDADLGVLRR